MEEKSANQAEKQAYPEILVPRPSAGADDKGARHRGDDCGCFRLFRKRSGADAGDDQNDDRGQILKHRRGSGVGIIDRHKKGKLRQADAENREKTSVIVSSMDCQMEGCECDLESFLRKIRSSRIRIIPALICRIQRTTGVGRARSCSRYCPEHPENPQQRVAMIMETVPSNSLCFVRRCMNFDSFLSKCVISQYYNTKQRKWLSKNKRKKVAEGFVSWNDI